MNERPVCFNTKRFFGTGLPICKNCIWFLICGSLLGAYFPLERREFIRKILLEGHRGTEPEVIEAIIKQYGGTKNATRLAVRYQRRKLELERRASYIPVVG